METTTVRCAICDAPFDTPRPDSARYCSARCANKRRFNCSNCGQPGVRNRRMLERDDRCDGCRSRSPQTTGYQDKECRRCGEAFTPLGANARYCSEECKRGTATCPECGEDFVVAKKSKGLWCSRECYYNSRAPVGSTRKLASGYVLIKVPKGYVATSMYGASKRWMFEHRWVMEQKLGRKLEMWEEVHHLNGQRDDNREENLELWKKSQPAGVRAADYHCPGCRCHEMS